MIKIYSINTYLAHPKKVQFRVGRGIMQILYKLICSKMAQCKRCKDGPGYTATLHCLRQRLKSMFFEKNSNRVGNKGACGVKKNFQKMLIFAFKVIAGNTQFFPFLAH